jgi:outer membrane protein OmpA-like peptidoglycan-associated protein
MITLPVFAQIIPPRASPAPSSPQPSEAPIAASIPARRENRVSPLDLTGLYESVPDSTGKYSAVMLQLNQAGKMVAGWFVAPPAWMPNRSSPRSGAKDEWLMPPGVLLGLIGRPLAQGLQFFWTSAKSGVTRPEDLLDNFTEDPPDILANVGRGARDGILKPTLRDGELESIYLMFHADLLGGADILTSPKAERFVRVKTTPRVSNFMRTHLPKQMQEALLSEQICPLPTNFVDAARAHLAPFDDPASVPPVAKLIEAWRQASDKPTRKTKRSQIEAAAVEAVLDLKASAAYRTTYERQLRAHMASFTLTVGSEKKTYLEWYQAVLAEEMDELDALRLEGKKLDDPPLVTTFRRVGITPSGHYAYTLSFAPLPVPGLGKLLGQKLGPSFIAHVGFAVVKVTIKKELLIYEKGLDGKIKLVDGKPAVQQRILLPFDSDKWFAGIYVDAGVGLGWAETPVTTPGGSPESKTKRTGNLGQIEFQTNIAIDSLKEFQYAYFGTGVVRGPGIVVGNFVSLDLLDSKYIEIRLQNNIVLSTVQEKQKFSPPKIPKWGDAAKGKQYIEGWTNAKLAPRLFDLSVGWGMLFELPGIAHTIKNTEFEPRDKTVSNKGDAAKQMFFRVQSADLDQFDTRSPSSLFKPRDVLEAFLATERMLFTTGDARVRVWGYASPEHTAQHNLGLSQQRADAVALAIKDAFGPALKVQEIQSKGLGEEIALRDEPGLLNPPDPIGDWGKKRPTQEAKWPRWRRVDLEIEGLVMVRLQGS